MNYDVFISCKSEDYQYAEEIYNFLKESGITVFLASTELRRLGESEYRKAISSALKAAHHMIVFASKPEYIDARWVYYEWDMFVNAKLKGFKPGNIVTILKDVDTKEINMDLWKYESLRFDDYKKSLVSYVETPESKQRLEQIKIAQKEEAEKQRQEQARIEKQLKIKRELVALAEDFKKKLTNLSVDIAKIKEKKRAIGNVNYECPVCSEINSIVNENCEKCGWPFSPIEGIEGAEYLNKDRKTLIEKFKALRTAKCNTEQIDDLNNQIASLQASLDEAEKEKKELLESNKSLADEVIKLREEKSKSKKDDDTNGSASGGSSNPKPSVFKGIINWIKSLNKSFWGYLALALLFVIVFVFLDKHADPKDFDLECFEADSCWVDTTIADTVEAEVVACDELMARFPDYLNVDEREVLQKLIDGMVMVEGGTFTMGATSEQGSDAFSGEEPHQVTLSDYIIGKTEVTQEQWEAVMGSNPSCFKGNNLPVEQVSWNDCQEFIKRLNSLTGLIFRLPTEAEWEYAARGGAKSSGYKYSGSNDIAAVAWYTNTTNDAGTKPVATKAPNELGLYDMTGNVWEWCSDWYGDYCSSHQTNPTGSSKGSYRVFRGGGWGSDARLCRVSNRSNFNPSNSSNILGLRLAL